MKFSKMLAMFILTSALSATIQAQSVCDWFTDDGFINGQGISEMASIGDNMAPTTFPYADFAYNVMNFETFKQNLPLGKTSNCPQEWVDRACDNIYSQYISTSQNRFIAFLNANLRTISNLTIPDNIDIIALNQEFNKLLVAALVKCRMETNYSAYCSCLNDQIQMIWITLRNKYNLSGPGPTGGGSISPAVYRWQSLVNPSSMDASFIAFMAMCDNY